MHSLLALLSLTLLTAVGTAQYVINPDSVPLSTREGWCNSQTNECPLICLQLEGSTGAQVNTCNATVLSYECLCSNGMSPNSSDFSQTLPYYVCQEWGNQCVANCGSDNNCAYSCRADHPCGAQDPVRVNITSSSTTMAGTASTTNTAAQTFGTFGSTPNPTGNSAARLKVTYSEVGNAYGHLVIAAGVVGGLAFGL